MRQGKPLKWKVQAVNTLTAVLLVLLSCIIAYSTILVPSQSLLSTSIANSLAYSANTLGRDLVAAETLSNLLYSDSVIQSQLSYLSQPAGITVRLNAKNRISSTLLHYVEQYSFLRIKHITIDSDALFCSTNETAYHQESDERHAALMEAADQADGALVIRVDAGDESRLQMIPLREELSLVAHYVEIQKIRFEDCLEYRAEIDDTLSAVEVPRLSIQPLVDNAIRYGMEGQYDEVCRVTLSIRAEGADTLVICVMNTGSAFEPDLLKRLASHELQPRGTGIGLLNIDKRLRLLYGTEGHLLLLNEDGLAKAMIRIPMQKRATEETAYAANDHCG